VRCPNCGVWIDPKRTGKQQRTFHKLCSSYSRASGISAAKVKVLMKYMHGVWIPLPTTELPDWPGQAYRVFEGSPAEKRVFLKSEAAYSKGEERVLIDGTIAECFDIGADIDWLEGATE